MAAATFLSCRHILLKLSFKGFHSLRHTIAIHARNLIFAVKRICNCRSAAFADVFQRFIESRPRFGVIAFGVIPRIAIDLAFAEIILFGTLPRFHGNPIITRFHLVGDCGTQRFLSFGKSGFRFLARSFVFRAGCAFRFGSNVPGTKINLVQAKKILSDKVSDEMSFTSKAGKPFKAKLKLDGEKVVFDFRSKIEYIKTRL